MLRLPAFAVAFVLKGEEDELDDESCREEGPLGGTTFASTLSATSERRAAAAFALQEFAYAEGLPHAGAAPTPKTC